MLIYDLHCHSHCSDGTLAPADVVARAVEQGVDVLALTDHDTTEGLQEAHNAAQNQPIRLINGIEFSSRWGRHGVHIVGLNLDLSCDELKQAETQQRQARLDRAEQIAERLAHKCNFQNTLAGAREFAGGECVGRPHFAQYLLEQGHVKTINEAFKKYLGSGKVGDVKQLWPEMGDVVDWITASGGVAVLAHPDKYKMTRTKLRALMGDFADLGGQSVELVSGLQVSGVAENLQKLAEPLGLLASCGSDFHRPGQHWQELGGFNPLPAGARPVWELFE